MILDAIKYHQTWSKTKSPSQTEAWTPVERAFLTRRATVCLPVCRPVSLAVGLNLALLSRISGCCDWPPRLMRNRCVPFNLNKSNLGTLVAHLAPNWHPHPARHGSSSSPGCLARHGALLMSFYCASGVLIAAIFNLIYAPVAQPTRWPTIDFTIKRGKGRGVGEQWEKGGSRGRRVGLSQFHNAFCMFSRVSRICLRNALWPGCARMYTPPFSFPPSPLPFCTIPLFPFHLFVCLCELACPFVASFMRRILRSLPATPPSPGIRLFVVVRRTELSAIYAVIAFLSASHLSFRHK